MRCPYCKESVQEGAVVCRFCGNSLEVQPPRQVRSAEQTELDRKIRNYEDQGWRVVSEDKQTANLARPKQIEVVWLVIWVIVALVFTPLTFGGSLVLFGLYYLLFVYNKREYITLSVNAEGRVRVDDPHPGQFDGETSKGGPVKVKSLATIVVASGIGLIVVCILTLLALRAFIGQ